MNRVKTGGRQKGTPNKNSAPVEELADELGINPLKVLFYFVAGDWKSLGYQSGEIIAGVSNEGEPFFKPVIEPVHRLTAAKEAAKYLYPQKKAIEISGDVKGVQVVVKDFTK